MGRKRLKTASSEKDHQRMAVWPPVGAMRPQRKLVPAVMALYGISAKGYSNCFLSGSDVQCILELDAWTLPTPGPSRGCCITTGDERADESGVWLVGDGDYGELSRLRRHAKGAGEKEEAMRSGGAPDTWGLLISRRASGANEFQQTSTGLPRLLPFLPLVAGPTRASLHVPGVHTRTPSPCLFGLSATSQQYFSLTTNQSSATSQQYFSLRTNQHQTSATGQTNMTLAPVQRCSTCRLKNKGSWT
jgi:hypothetical protein